MKINYENFIQSSNSESAVEITSDKCGEKASRFLDEFREGPIRKALGETTYVLSGSFVLHRFMSIVLERDPEFEPSDVDVFGDSYQRIKMLLKSFTAKDLPTVYAGHSDRDIKFEVPEVELSFDFVTRRFGTAKDIASGHDLSPCAIAVNVNGGEPASIAFTREFEKTLTDSKMRMQKHPKNRDAVSAAHTIDRVFKYKSRGFEPTFELLQSLAAYIYSSGNEQLAEDIKNVTDTEKSA